MIQNLIEYSRTSICMCTFSNAIQRRAESNSMQKRIDNKVSCMELDEGKDILPFYTLHGPFTAK